MSRISGHSLLSWRSWIGLDRLTLRLGLFILFVGFVLNVVLFAGFGLQTPLHQSVDLATLNAEVDSWWPIRAAREVAGLESRGPLYQEVFSASGAKFIYPLTSLMVLEPFLRLEDAMGRPDLIMNLIGCASVLGTAVVVALILLRSTARHLGRSPSLLQPDGLALAGVGMAATLSFQPIVEAFTLGQIQTWLNFLFCAAVLAWMQERKGLAGSLTAAIILIKPQFTLFLVWALIRKEWRYFWFAAIPPCVLFAGSFLFFGYEDHLDYIALLSTLSERGEAFYPNQSINGLLNRLLHNGSNLVWVQTSYPPYNVWVHAGTVLSSAVIIGLALFWRRREHDGASLTDFLVAGLSFTLASPLAWEHHYGVLIAMFAATFAPTVASARLGAGSLVLLAVAYVLTGNLWRVTNELADTPLNFMQSYLFFGAVLVLIHLYRLRHAEFQAGAPGATRLATAAA